METVVEVERIVEANFGDRDATKTSSATSLSHQIADPVVYKLVRVEGDGRLVPATDEEVMEVEDLLEDDKRDIHIVADTVEAVGCTSRNGVSSAKIQLRCSEGLLQPDNREVEDGKLNASPDPGVDLGTLDPRPEEIVPSSAANSNDNHIEHSRGWACSNASGGLVGSELSTSIVNTNCSMPDFSKLSGEICLDNLTVRELHETFKATFGRETNVKDKSWLKRRISMALTNSCDVSTTSFIIEGHKVVKKGKEVEEKNENVRDQSENRLNISGRRLQRSDYSGDDVHAGHRAAKRVRKPTKRYLEQVSEVEYKEYVSGKLTSSVKTTGRGHSYPEARTRPVQYFRSDGRPVVTRQDSLGGSGVQIPYVSRVRRSRPRENFMALLRLQPRDMGMAARLVTKALGAHEPQTINKQENKVFKARPVTGWVQNPIITEPENDEQYMERKTTKLENDMELKQTDSSGDNSDDNDITTAHTVKNGMRRKHHRPWTLSEVVKLVEGVARYGAGRWSEIKRVAFASYSYRTSVDLKDKWRNLLRASFSPQPADKGIQNSRKQASSIVIPDSILVRVRELAEMQEQLPPDLIINKFAEHSGRSVQETQLGYL